MDERDLQKLIYHSVFGGDHLLDDAQCFADGVRAEWDRLATGDFLPRIEPLQLIDPDGRTARIHLAACRRLDVDLGALIALLAGQGRKNGERAEYETRWDAVIELARIGRIPFRVAELARMGYPSIALHHGPHYGFASYRVVNDLSDPGMNEGLRRLGVRI